MGDKYFLRSIFGRIFFGEEGFGFVGFARGFEIHNRAGVFVLGQF
jgi:hypothetical protein